MTAMACGRAVVVSDIEQNVETIGDTGATFVSEDPASLARVLTALIRDPQEVERLGGLARARIETVYNWDAVVDQPDRLYRRISPTEVSARRLTASVNPFDHAIDFWKPLMEPHELEALASYCDPGEPLLSGHQRVANGFGRASLPSRARRRQFSLFAAVHPIEDVPQSAEVVADILDRSGEHYSYVLRFPGEGSVVVPFDPNAAVESFWREEYVPPAKRTVLPRPLLSLYYAAQADLPRGLKTACAKALARRTRASEHFLEWPTDQSLDMLQRLLLRLILIASGRQELQFAWFWPDRHPWAAVLTHDVETAAGLARVPHVAEIERQRGLRSSFNLVPLRLRGPDSLLRSLREGGFEIGVHGYTHDGLLFSSWSTVREARGPHQRVRSSVECLGFSVAGHLSEPGVVPSARFRVRLVGFRHRSASSRSRGAARRSSRIRWAI